MKPSLNIFAVALLAVFVLFSTTWALSPQLITYQGRVTDGVGESVPDGAYNLTLSIFDASEAGQVLWTEVQSGVTVSDGLFSVIMGSLEPLPDSIFNAENRYLEVTVNGQTMSPRTQFTSVAYSHRVNTLDGANAGEVSGELRISPKDFTTESNAITIVNANDAAVATISVGETGLGTISLYDPVDSKLNPDLASLKLLDISVLASGRASISFYDPVDSKAGTAFAEKKVEMNYDGIIMFGESESDTNLVVAPNGDIRGLGQLTMGENSSSGTETSVLGFNNTAAGDSSSIGGGSANVADGTASTIGGGFQNTAGGTGAMIGGGSSNTTAGDYATIAGGQFNSAEGSFATVPGGQDNVASGGWSQASGRRAQAMHDGAFVWADHTDADFASTAPDQFIIRASGGVGIGTDNPTAMLDVVGPAGNDAVKFPDDALSAPELLDEPGIAGTYRDATVELAQKSNDMMDLAVTAITTPADGYIMVRGGTTLIASGTNKRNQAYLQIDENSGGGLLPAFYVVAGPGSVDYDKDSPDIEHYVPVSIDRIYFKPAGTYEFRIEARAHAQNGDGSVTQMLNPRISALFIPTAYGALVQPN